MSSRPHSLDRIITGRMSANMVADLLRVGISLQEMARALDVEPNFLSRVQRKQHSFTFRDVKRLAKLTNHTPELLLFNAIRPVRSDVKGLFDSTREMLQTCGSVEEQLRRKKPKKSSARPKAA